MMRSMPLIGRASGNRISPRTKVCRTSRRSWKLRAGCLKTHTLYSTRPIHHAIQDCGKIPQERALRSRHRGDMRIIRAENRRCRTTRWTRRAGLVTSRAMQHGPRQSSSRRSARAFCGRFALADAMNASKVHVSAGEFEGSVRTSGLAATISTFDARDEIGTWLLDSGGQDIRVLESGRQCERCARSELLRTRAKQWPATSRFFRARIDRPRRGRVRVWVATSAAVVDPVAQTKIVLDAGDDAGRVGQRRWPDTRWCTMPATTRSLRARFDSQDLDDLMRATHSGLSLIHI